MTKNDTETSETSETSHKLWHEIFTNRADARRCLALRPRSQLPWWKLPADQLFYIVLHSSAMSFDHFRWFYIGLNEMWLCLGGHHSRTLGLRKRNLKGFTHGARDSDGLVLAPQRSKTRQRSKAQESKPCCLTRKSHKRCWHVHKSIHKCLGHKIPIIYPFARIEMTWKNPLQLLVHSATGVRPRQEAISTDVRGCPPRLLRQQQFA